MRKRQKPRRNRYGRSAWKWLNRSGSDVQENTYALPWPIRHAVRGRVWDPVDMTVRVAVDAQLFDSLYREVSR